MPSSFNKLPLFIFTTEFIGFTGNNSSGGCTTKVKYLTLKENA